MANVQFDHVYKRYGDVVAVTDLDLSVHDKEFLVLVGPSGCGKTTALRMVAGLEDISGGYIRIGDRVVNDVAPKDRDIAMVFQSYALYPHMSIYENMAFGLRRRHTERSVIDKRVRDAARTLEIEHLLDRKPRQLSGGQRQRVALGRAIVREPQVFLMDEPLSNLDAKLRVQTRAELAKLHQRLQVTTIYVTHDQVEAMTMGSRIVVMSKGIAQQIDAPQNIYEHPANIFVATFIGSPGMNLIPGDLKARDHEVVFDAKKFSLTLTTDQAAVARGYLGKHVVLGVRPEDIMDADTYELEARARQAALHAAGTATAVQTRPQTVTAMKVDIVEHMGSELYLYLDAGQAQPLVGRIAVRTDVRPGATFGAMFDVTRLHLFDADSEAAIF